MDFVDDHPLQARKCFGGIGIGQQKRQGFRRGQQDMRRIGALSAALGVAGVAGAILDPYGQARAFNRTAQVAADVGRQRLERRDIQRVQALIAPRQFRERGQKPRQCLAAARGGYQQSGGIMCAVQHG